MREGGILYIEEFNCAPEDKLNTLLTARPVTWPGSGAGGWRGPAATVTSPRRYPGCSPRNAVRRVMMKRE